VSRPKTPLTHGVLALLVGFAGAALAWKWTPAIASLPYLKGFAMCICAGSGAAAVASWSDSRMAHVQQNGRASSLTEAALQNRGDQS
jgi:hypothetical protein